MKNRLKLLLGMALIISGVANAQVGIGTTNPNASAALDVNSTTGGVLVSRMNSTQRDAIASPANGLLIFNTSNNTFEVYKSTCSCWVTINDNGNTAAASLVNTAPTANTLNYTGIFRDGGSASIVYTYADAQGDAEGATTLQWEIANDAIGTSKTNLSTGVSVTFSTAQVGRYVRIKIIPRAATGILNGIPYYGDWKLIGSGAAPYGSALSVTGTAAQGSLLTGVYTFNGGSGVENSLGSTYNWQSATNNVGLNIQNLAIPDGATDFTTNIRLLSTEVGRYVRFGVKATDNAFLSATDFVYSNWVGPVTLAVEAAPTASNVTYSPASPGTNVILTGSYTYGDANEDPEGTSLFQWYTADDATGTNQTAIAGANAATFTVTNAQATKFIGVGVTPVATTGTTTGTQVVYYAPTASVGSASFTFTGATQISNNFYTNRVMDATDKISVSINVTSVGSIAFSTTTVNGYTFSGGGTYTLGAHTVTLAATGTQTAYNAGGDAFTITGVGATTETTSLTVNHVRFGANFTAHYNGITAGVSVNNLLATYTTGETFSNNGECLTKVISTSACVGTSLTVGSNTYPLVNINGQCWMQTNIKEISTAPCGQPINTGCNLLLAGQENNDTGAWGFYNTTTTNGTSGWATSEPVSGDGALYQWSAAMNGETSERAKGVCPTGFHIPSDCEWMYLEHGLGMSISQQTTLGSIRSNTADNEGTPGNKLRSEGTGATNISGFSGKLTGSRATIGTFALRAANGGFWTSTQGIGIFALRRNLLDGNRGVNRNTASKQSSYSVRCLKD